MQPSHHFFFVDVLLGQAEFLRFAQNVIVVIDIHHQISTSFFGQTDALIVNQTGVFNGIDAGQDRILDALRAVGMGSDLTSGHVGLFRRSFKFFGRVLRRAGTITFRKHAAAGDDLDHIHAVLDLGAHHVADLVHAIGNLKISFLRKHAHSRLWRVVVQIAVSAGNRYGRPTGYNAWPRHQSFVDGVAEVHREKRL